MDKRAAAYSDLDSRRFGKRIFRAHVDCVADAAAVESIGRSERVDLMIVRCPVERIEVIHALESSGYLLMDTLLYYAGAPQASREDSPHIIRAASLEDRESLERVAVDCFTNYFGHYHADLRLDSAVATLGYAEWCVSSVGAPGHTVWLAVEGGVVTGFIILRQLGPRSVPEIVLNGVGSSYRRRGIYSSLFRKVSKDLADAGVSEMRVSTQVHNLSPQRIWTRNGLFLQQAVHTFHRWFDS
jgi:hypothetical protein